LGGGHLAGIPQGIVGFSALSAMLTKRFLTVYLILLRSIIRIRESDCPTSTPITPMFFFTKRSLKGNLENSSNQVPVCFDNAKQTEEQYDFSVKF
jgi:hypothetical protein